jgi:hypothetical protein
LPATTTPNTAKKNPRRKRNSALNFTTQLNLANERPKL